MLFRFVTKHACDRRSDRQAGRQTELRSQDSVKMRRSNCHLAPSGEYLLAEVPSLNGFTNCIDTKCLVYDRLVLIILSIARL